MKKLALATVILTTTAGMAFAANSNNQQNNQPNNPPPAPEHHHMMPEGQGGHNGGKGFHKMGNKSDLPRGFEQLNLTDAQKAKIKSIVESNQPAPKTQPDHSNFQQKMQARQAAEQKLLSSKNFDEAAARQMILERQQERLNQEREQAEHELNMLKKRHAIFQVLTPEQQKQFAENQQKHMKQFMNRKP